MKSVILFRLIFPCLFSFLFLFESCAALKKRNYQPEAMTSAPLVSSIETPTFTKGSWPAYNWWTTFEDDQLSEIMEKAIEENPDLLAAVARVKGAKAQAEKMRAPLLPNLQGGFTDDYQHLSKDELVRYPPSVVPAVINEIHLSLNFDYEIDLFGKNRNQYRAALDDARAQAAEMSQSLLMITTSLAEAYINYGAQLMEQRISQDLVDVQKLYAELTERRFENGLEDQRAVDHAKVLLLEAEEKLLEKTQNVEVTKSQLKILMGIGPDDPYVIKTPTIAFEKPFPIPEDLPLNLLARRPDLMAEVWKVESAAHLIKAAKAAFFPNINLKAFAGLQSLHWHNLFSLDSFAGSITPAIHLPLYTGGELTGALNQQYANYDAAVYNYNALILKAAKEVSDQIVILEKTTEQAQLENEAFLKVMEISELTLKRYENGIDNYLTVLSKQIDVINEALVEVKVQNNRYLSVLMLIKSLGGGYEPIPN